MDLHSKYGPSPRGDNSYLNSIIAMHLCFFGRCCPCCMLTNHCMPLFVLNNQISYFILLPWLSLYLHPPRVIGGACFVGNLRTGQDTLFAKGHKMDLLEIFQTSEGMCCYSLNITRCFLSLDITLFKQSPFFSSMIEPISMSDILLPPHI